MSRPLTITLPVSGSGSVPDTAAPDLTPVPLRVNQPSPVPLGGDLAAAMMSAAASRPVEEVADLLCHLNPAHTPTLAPVLHGAVAARPVEDLVRLLILLRPRDSTGADQILRAAVLTRPTGDVAHLTALLAAEADSGIQAALHAAASLRPVADVAHLVQLLRPAPVADRPAGPSTSGDDTEPLAAATEQAAPDAAALPPARVLSRARPREERPPLRWPAAAALVMTGALHVPLVAALWGQNPDVSMVAGLSVLCLLLAVPLGVRGTPWTWIAGVVPAAAAFAGYLLFDTMVPVRVAVGIIEWQGRFGPAALVCEAAVLVLTLTHALTPRRRRTSVGAGRRAVRRT
ncbi:hypothetical protein [Kitasatospora sp. NPDC005751]|uniref:hypothetical protein n=1 Tax=unclassified Kitasatospora TaxID=2633591 RepID=UPI0033F5D0D2